MELEPELSVTVPVDVALVAPPV
jgi:hypothetical protein